jgi:hypothetical protein
MILLKMAGALNFSAEHDNIVALGASASQATIFSRGDILIYRLSKGTIFIMEFWNR